MESLEEIYKQLNTAQRRAVDTIDGPLLVLAGPGTGKTQLLSARVANILTKTDTDPSNVICLTFTVNASNNMRARLRSMIGPAANHVVIKTFHSLAAEIIANQPEHFYAGAVLNPVSELAAQEIMQGIFDKLPHDSPLATTYDQTYIHIGNALEAIGRAKDAGLTPEKLRKALQAHQQELERIEPQIVELSSTALSHKKLPQLAEDIATLASSTQAGELTAGICRLFAEAITNDLPTNKTTNTGKLKAKLLSTQGGKKTLGRERRANSWWQSLSTVYESYQQILYKRGYMDYSDMLIGVIEALEQDQDLRFDLQESMQYVLVDEFQDSNQAQINLLHLLVDNPNIESPNVMVVGDPNQTIYGFNGAMLDNITDFQAFYQKSLRTINLINNYRSSQSILDESRQVITPYTQFYPDLVAHTDPSPTYVHYANYPAQADQAVTICEQIQQLRHANSGQSIAVLARSHTSLAYLAHYLHQAKIIVNYEQSIDIRTTSCNQLIITTLELVAAILAGDKPIVNHTLSLLLRHPVFALNPNDLWQIALTARAQRTWFETAQDHPATQAITHWLQELATVAASQPLHVLIEQLLSTEFASGKTLYQSFYTGDTSESTVTAAQATRQLLELAKQYAQTEDVSLEAFLAMVAGAPDKLFRFNPSTGHYEDGVTLMSIHAAKGLEFDHVFIVDVDEANWKPKAPRYPTPLNLPIHINLDTPADYARLLYVAMTRARQTLALSYVSRIDAKTVALPAEQLAHATFTLAKPVTIEAVAEAEGAQLVFPRPRVKTMRELLGDQLINYQLSATALTHFLDLSREGMATFIEENLLRLPQPVSDVLAHGNAMHAALELAQIQTTNHRFDLAAIKRLYSLKLAEESLTSALVERLTARANQQLEALFGVLQLSLSSDSKSEQSLTAVTAKGVSMYGKIDRIDIINDRTIRIVDYKTGKPIENPHSKAKDVLLKQWRHKLQLGFYVLLLKEQKPYAHKTIQTQIIQLDATASEHLCLDYELTPEELNHIEQLATAVYKRILQLDIPDVLSFPSTLEGIHEFEHWLLA